MKNIHSKRGSAIGFLGKLVLALVVAFIVIVTFKLLSGRGAGALEAQYESLKDFDGDHVANFYDQCPCTDFGASQSSTLSGCPSGTTAEQSQKDKRDFREKKCPATALTTGTESATASAAPGALTVTVDGVAYKSGAPRITTTSSSLFYTFSCSVPCTVEITGSDSALLAEHNQNAAGTYPLELKQSGSYLIHLYGDGVDLGIDIEKTN